MFLRWFAYGYVLGLVGWIALVAVFMSHDWRPGSGIGWAFDYLLRKGPFGFVWAVPWAVANGVCGIAAESTGPRLTAAAAVAGLGGGVAYNFSGVFTFGGWLAVTLPACCIALMLAAVGVVWLVGLIVRHCRRSES